MALAAAVSVVLAGCAVSVPGSPSSGGGMSGGGSSGGMSGGGSSGGGGPIRGVSGSVPGMGGVGGMEGSDCDTGGWGGSDEACEGSVGQYPGETTGERKARLEGELEESVGGFDEVLADEQREISTVGRNTEGFGGGQGGAGTGRVGLGGQAGGDSGSGEPGSVAGPQEQRRPSVGGLTEEEIRARTPDDIPDLVSEDIVARQLREAALAEEDPELRERLWDEYRMYNDLN